MLELRFSPDDLLRCRFAISPLTEALQAARTLLFPSRHPVHLPWLRHATERASDLDLAPLRAMFPLNGYTPDFLAPPPASPIAEVGEELARVRATPVDELRTELEWVAEDSGAELMRAVPDDPETARDLLADLIEAIWQRLVEPFWPRMRDLLDADVVFRARQLAAGGLEAVLAGLHPRVRWLDGVVQVTDKPELHRDLVGEGVLLVPSVFVWPEVRVQLDAPWQPTIIYPARGVGALWEPADATPSIALARLVGQTRASLLIALAEPATTTSLARRHELAPSTVSEHLAALRDAGLVSAYRAGRQVQYERSPIGHALLNAGRSA